jgi:hypothetical protein
LFLRGGLFNHPHATSTTRVADVFFLKTNNTRPATSPSIRLFWAFGASKTLGIITLDGEFFFRNRHYMGFMKRSLFQVALRVFKFIGIAFVFAACSGSSPSPVTQSTDLPSLHTPTEELSNVTSTPINISTSSPLPTQIITITPSLSPTPDTRLIPYYWRDWPVTPDLSPKAQGILLSAINNPALDLHVLSKVGDCQMTPATFLGGFANGVYPIPSGLDGTVSWFSNSMTSESVTAANGLGINSVLNPMFGLAAGNTQCQANETPLDCELRTRHPALVLIAMGTNWKPHGEVSFEKYLRQVVDRIMETGALPILATKADDIEGDWKLDLAIAHVAYDYDLPLVNVWRSVQNLPEHGLKPPLNEYLTGDGWMAANYAWLNTLEKVRQVFVK